MRGFRLSRYIKKWLPLIVAFFAAATAGSYVLLNALQGYTASAVISYAKAEAPDGLAPDGTEINLSEINSSANMAKVMERLDLDAEVYTLDQLCASIAVTPVEEEQSEAIQEALNEEGEEYTEKPITYIVSCTLGKPANEDMVRDILNETLDVYFEDYGNRHVSQGEISNVTKHFPDSSYDYLEMVEEIDASLESTIDVLDTRYAQNVQFRSTVTGYSFADLRDRFSLLREVRNFRLYSQNIGNQITKDRDLLLAKYRNRIDNYGLIEEKAQEDIEEALKVINTYVQKMRESENTGMDYNYILDEVYGDQGTDENGERTIIDRSVEYDNLLKNWVYYNNTWDQAVIDAAYCQFIIGIYEDGTGSSLFSGLVDSENGNEVSEDVPITQTETEGPETVAGDPGAGMQEKGNVAVSQTAGGKMAGEADAQTNTVARTEMPSISQEQLSGIFIEKVTEEDVEADIAEVVAEMNALYEICDLTNQEYNEYQGAQSIQTLSSTSVEAAFNLKLFMGLIAVCFLVVGCCGAVVLGRAGDILEYMFLMDHRTGCMNRVSCDNYIRHYEKLVLTGGFCCIYLQIINQRELNRLIGRDGADEVLKKTADILKNVFGNRRGGFVGYNGSGQFWAFYESKDESIEQIRGYVVSVMSDTFAKYSVVYALGTVNAEDEKTYKLRPLISKAVAGKVTYETVPSDSTETKIERKGV